MAETERLTHPRTEQSLWVLGLLTFGVGDILTTAVGLGVGGVTEASPVGAVTLDYYGLPGMVTAKLLAVSVLAGLWRVTPRPHAVGVPLGLALLGAAVVGWNTVVVLAAILA